MPAVQLITPSEYARRRGCSETAVRKAIAKKRITAFDHDGEKRIDPTVADIQWAANTRARVGSGPSVPPTLADAASATAAPATEPAGDGAAAATTPPTPPQAQNYDDHKTRQARADAERAELEVGRMAGRLLDKERAERGAFDAFRELRDAWFAANETCSRKVLGMVEQSEIKNTLDDEARTSLADWERRLVARLAEGAGA